jgi:DNA-directed RNA polymerase subunit N (RpoN/RPB10)
MDSWQIRPFDGVGPLKFGMSRSSIRGTLGGKFRTFRKTRRSESETEAYDELGLHFYYDAKDELNFIEAFPQCGELSWNQVRFFHGDLQTVVEKMREAGQSEISDSSGRYFEGLGISLYAPYAGRIESVGAFRRDKWEEYLQLLREREEKNRLRAERGKTSGFPKNPFQSNEEKK